MFWLAQMRAGVAKPEFVAAHARRGLAAAAVAVPARRVHRSRTHHSHQRGDDEDNSQPNTSTDERLCEALFYVGEAYWARGQPEVARDYFAALVNIKVIYFLEHGLALAEIAKLRDTRCQQRPRGRPFASEMGSVHHYGPDLAAAAHHVLVRRELLHAHRPARMKAIGGDADLRAHAELAAVGELRGGVVQHDGAIHALEEALRGGAHSR